MRWNKKVYKIVVFFVFAVFCFSVSAQTKNTLASNQEHKGRKKVAVVLSGGGAKGTAHIGALKVLEKAGIPIDMIVGTSMGALMGGLYSIGYDATMLDSLVRIQDWPFLLSDRVNPLDQSLLQRQKQDVYALSLAVNDISKLRLSKTGFVKGKNLANLFSKLTLGYHDSLDFNKLPIPFACVATDMVKYQEVDFHSGNLATAMRSSMSIPAVFAPVYLDSMVLVDGGLMNNYPVDVAKQMGADIVIGVTVQSLQSKTPEYFSSMGSVLNQLLDVNTEAKFYDNLAMTDVFIKVDVEGYSAASFNLTAIDTLIRRGEDAAMEQWEALVKIRESLGIDTNNIEKRKLYHMASHNVRMKISDVEFVHFEKNDIKYLQEKFNLKTGQTTTIDQIEKALSAIRTNLFYNDASYQIRYRSDGYGIIIQSEGKKSAEVFMGARYDNEEKVSMQFNGTLPVQFIVPTVLQGTLRFGKRSMVQLDATFNPSSFASFTVSYTYNHNDMNLYHKGDRNLNPDYHQHRLSLGFMNYGFKNFLCDIFAQWDYYRYSQLLVGTRQWTKYVPVSHMYSYHARIHYDDRINRYFASQGQKYEIHYSLYTDNFYQYEGGSPLHALSYNFSRLFPHGNLVIEPKVYGRSVFDDNVPTILSNAIGGHYFAHYVEQQMPFAGIGNIEQVEDNFAAVELNLRYRILKNNYVSLAFAAGEMSKALKNIFSSSPILGVRASYSYNSIIGPLGASVGYSTRTDSPYLFVNIGYEF